MDMRNPNYQHIRVKLNDKDAIDASVSLSAATHKALLEYLLARLDESAKNRSQRLTGFARIDKQVSTWQMLSEADQERERKEDMTGRQQAIPMNLPVTDSYIEDTAAFFSEIFAPLNGEFYAGPSDKAKEESAKKLADAMRTDARYRKYYKNILATFRSLLKYNVGGLMVEWQEGSVEGTAVTTPAGNNWSALDMYNFDYDQSITDLSNLSQDGEWFAMFEERSRLWLIREQKAGRITGLSKLLNQKESSTIDGSESTANKAKYFRHPPNHAGIRNKDTKGTSRVDWEGYGVSLSHDSQITIRGHEVIRMFCFMNPNQFRLNPSDSVELYEFRIVDASQIVSIKRHETATQLPAFAMLLRQDDMKEMTKSAAELTHPFQRMASFSLNSHIAAIRGSVWGVNVIDPNMFDPEQLKGGDTAVTLVSKQPGKDIKAGFAQHRPQHDTSKQIQDVSTMLDLLKQFFPNQALPNQVGGIDRAVTNQVAAVMQGAMRKMHMFVRLIDSDMMGPARNQAFRNIIEKDKLIGGSLRGLTEEDVADILGGGLKQLVRDLAMQMMQNLIALLMQNPASAAEFDLSGIMATYSQMMGAGVNLGDYARKTPAGVQGATEPNPPPGAAGAAEQPVI